MRLPACDVCGAVITRPASAVLSLDTHAVAQRQDEAREWRKRKRAEKVSTGMAVTSPTAPGDPDRPLFIWWSAAELGEMPDTAGVHWLWTCVRCMPAEQSYWIDGDRLTSLEKVLSWTLHLAEKRWWVPAAWEEAVRRLWDVGNA